MQVLEETVPSVWSHLNHMRLGAAQAEQAGQQGSGEYGDVGARGRHGGAGHGGVAPVDQHCCDVVVPVSRLYTVGAGAAEAAVAGAD